MTAPIVVLFILMLLLLISHGMQGSEIKTLTSIAKTMGERIDLLVKRVDDLERRCDTHPIWRADDPPTEVHPQIIIQSPDGPCGDRTTLLQ